METRDGSRWPGGRIRAVVAEVSLMAVVGALVGARVVFQPDRVHPGYLPTREHVILAACAGAAYCGILGAIRAAKMTKNRSRILAAVAGAVPVVIAQGGL